jgi:hypothetical protein
LGKAPGKQCLQQGDEHEKMPKTGLAKPKSQDYAPGSFLEEPCWLAAFAVIAEKETILCQ